MKYISTLILVLGTTIASYAQNAASSASQTVKLNLSNAIEITYTGSGNNTGADVNLNFLTINEYANGVESGDQWMKVRSNKDFAITVKANAEEFTYKGYTVPAPQMKVKDVLGLKVKYNYTGGTIAPQFANNYHHLTANDADLITNCDRGGDQTFAVEYKATPGFQYPAGTYSVDVTYTATQL